MKEIFPLVFSSPYSNFRQVKKSNIFTDCNILTLCFNLGHLNCPLHDIYFWNLILLHFIDRQTIVLWKAKQFWIVPSTETVLLFLVMCWVMSSHHYLKRIQSRYTDGDKNEPERIYFKCLTFFYSYFNAFRIFLFFWYFFFF